ncbi:hypothetical protein NQP46_29555 [Streptomyces albus]|nr:hypothetical protein NQP46_29555 [Streptomyces albus]
MAATGGRPPHPPRVRRTRGVTGALGNHADRIWAEHVEPGEETEARRLFVQLVRLPLGSAVATRRLVRRGDLGEKQWHLAQRLAAHTRLLVTDRTTDGTETVELTHEALITRWEKLAAWVAEDRSFLRWRETVRHERDRWQEADHAPEHLPTAAALAGAEQWLPDREASVGQAEREYLAAGRTRRRTRARRRRALLSGLATAVALTLVFSALYLVERRSSQERTALGASRALAQAAAAESSATDPAHAALLSLAAYDTSPTQEAENELLRQYLQNAFYDRVLSGDIADNYSYFDTSRDGEVVLTASRRSGAMLFLRALTGPVRMVRLPSPERSAGSRSPPTGSAPPTSGGTAGASGSTCAPTRSGPSDRCTGSLMPRAPPRSGTTPGPRHSPPTVRPWSPGSGNASSGGTWRAAGTARSQGTSRPPGKPSRCGPRPTAGPCWPLSTVVVRRARTARAACSRSTPPPAAAGSRRVPTRSTSPGTGRGQSCVTGGAGVPRSASTGCRTGLGRASPTGRRTAASRLRAARRCPSTIPASGWL